MKWLGVSTLIAIVLAQSVLCSAAAAKNVLVLDGVGSPSHQVWMHRLTRAIAQHGYNVTALSCKMHEKAPASLHSYHLENIYSGIAEEDVDFMEMGSMGTWEKFFMFSSFLSLMDELAITANGFQQVMNFPKDFKFDLIVFDYLSPLTMLVLADRFPEASLIGASAYPAIEYTNVVTKAPNFASFIPNLYMDDVEDCFFSRLESFLIYFVNDFFQRYSQFPSSQKIADKHYKTKRSLSEIYSSTKIQLVNYHPVLDFVQPIMPGVIPVGGLQVSERHPLPKDLQKIFDLPSKGVILFSLGSNVKSELLGEARLKEIIGALKEIPDYTFIWKIDLTGLNLEIPKNVFIEKWLPQNDILAHNKTVLFISHAGGLSTQESSWYGVPMLALPVMFDQFPNAEKAIKAGMALKLDVRKIKKEELKSTILELLNNDKYSKQAKIRSSNFRDQKETPIERALWWIDYIARNPDVTFLKSPKLEAMNYFVKHSMDVIAFLALLALLLLLITVKVIRIIIKSQRKRKQKLKSH